ncbi:MAG: enoyl-CoA hydratase/isomerase family protein [Gammaproteobacteria bacterium]|nr:enoyl-CoA hydratase/isomerase family protein [Gammaproteobacteria bacterium]
MEIRIEEPSPHIALITIDHQAKFNAMSRQMLADVARLWDELEHTAHRCVVIRGAGGKAFSSGADVSGDLSAEPEQAAIINRALLKTSTFRKPIIAAVNGVCAGGGVELLLATDLRVAATHARFGLPEVKWSIYPFGGATVKLIKQIGYVHGMDLLLTGRMVDATFAQEIGLINRVVKPEDLLDDCLQTAEMIAANSPSAVQAVKQQISATLAEHAQSREALDQQLGDEVRNGPHFDEGVAAFREKRSPNY